MFGALRRAIDDQYRRRGCDDIKNADKSLLAHDVGETSRQREQHGADGGEQQAVGEACRARRSVPAREGDGGAQRRELGESEIGKDDIPAQHMNAEIGVDENERDRSRERNEEQRERIAHCALRPCVANASASVATLWSNNAR